MDSLGIYSKEQKQIVGRWKLKNHYIEFFCTLNSMNMVVPSEEDVLGRCIAQSVSAPNHETPTLNNI
ncbi:hypothetical protein H5410_061085 [Solanum commersonii]|uniref:Uncharacterized protein n=1 Tax=Solanum commersonii TaxID=4109 RepID=A0A9J5W7K8_SOLCO|nr:hypothetical protein H5410_061085 [Solanum commersonii]